MRIRVESMAGSKLVIYVVRVLSHPIRSCGEVYVVISYA